jgi:hypothetical protein
MIHFIETNPYLVLYFATGLLLALKFLRLQFLDAQDKWECDPLLYRDHIRYQVRDILTVIFILNLWPLAIWNLLLYFMIELYQEGSFRWINLGVIEYSLRPSNPFWKRFRRIED